MYAGSAYVDEESYVVVLTEPENGQTGLIWLNQPIQGDFEVSFSFIAGGGTGADGFVMQFYQERPEELLSGEDMGIAGSGYGVEFDNYQNDEPSEHHIALIKENTDNHLILVNDARACFFRGGMRRQLYLNKS